MLGLLPPNPRQDSLRYVQPHMSGKKSEADDRLWKRIRNVEGYQPRRWSILPSQYHERHCPDRLAAILLVLDCQSPFEDLVDGTGLLLGSKSGGYGWSAKVSLYVLRTKFDPS